MGDVISTGNEDVCKCPVLFAHVMNNLEHVCLPSRLEDLWLNDNQIASLEGIETLLQGCINSLSTVYLERNPCVCSHTLHLELYPLLIYIAETMSKDKVYDSNSFPDKF